MPKIGLLVRIESKAEYADRGWEQCLRPVDDRGGVVPSRSPASPQARSARQRRSEGYDPCSP